MGLNSALAMCGYSPKPSSMFASILTTANVTISGIVAIITFIISGINSVSVLVRLLKSKLIGRPQYCRESPDAKEAIRLGNTITE